MSHLSFSIKTAKLIDAGNVQRSRFGTAGPHPEATGRDRGVYAVFDDVSGSVGFFRSAAGAAYDWHQMNLRYIRSRP